MLDINEVGHSKLFDNSYFVINTFSLEQYTVCFAHITSDAGHRFVPADND